MGTKYWWPLPEARRGKGFFPTFSGATWLCWHLDLGLLDFRSEIKHFYSLTSPTHTHMHTHRIPWSHICEQVLFILHTFLWYFFFFVVSKDQFNHKTKYNTMLCHSHFLTFCKQRHRQLFVPDYSSKDICVMNSLRRQK